MSSPIARVTLHCSMAVALAACGGGSSGAPCTMDDQCPSHFCRADDTCAPLGSADAGTGTDGNGSGTRDGGDALCTPNHDGTITQPELPLAAGNTANYLIATDATWNTAGTANTDNTRTWDLSGALAGDTQEPLTLGAPSGAWWASDFSGATYATVLSTAQPTLLGVFHVDATGVTLLGVVSTTGGTGSTELSYSPPAKILALPFMAGSTWTSTSTVTGLAEGIAADYTETYASDVDQAGTMKTPYGTFPVLRVATNLSRDSIAYNRTFAWVAECFGSVAQVQSPAYPSTVPTGEFDDPAEAWRITP